MNILEIYFCFHQTYKKCPRDLEDIQIPCFRPEKLLLCIPKAFPPTRKAMNKN